MTQSPQGLTEFHWLIEVLQTVDVGILVLDLEYRITAWNGFMENNSGINSTQALDQSLFTVFPEVSQASLVCQSKIERILSSSILSVSSRLRKSFLI